MDQTRIETNLTRVRQRISNALRRVGRRLDSVTLVAVTKGRSNAEVQALYDLGVRHFGENRVAEAESKIQALPPDCQWHMIGTVQRRKARDIVRLFRRVDSVDRYELAATLDQRSREGDRVLPILVEVNVSGEASKHGIEPGALKKELDRISALEHITVSGLMTMAPLCENPEIVRPVFCKLRELAESNGLETLSMGMSGDFEVAIEEGATEVRVGSALFDL